MDTYLTDLRKSYAAEAEILLTIQDLADEQVFDAYCLAAQLPTEKEKYTPALGYVILDITDLRHHEF
jgi:hypothetical protein